MNTISEDIPEWKSDSDIIFTAITTANFDNFQQAQQAIVQLYVPDLSFSRAGISHALKLLQKFYTDTNTSPPL